MTDRVRIFVVFFCIELFCMIALKMNVGIFPKSVIDVILSAEETIENIKNINKIINRNKVLGWEIEKMYENMINVNLKKEDHLLHKFGTIQSNIVDINIVPSGYYLLIDKGERHGIKKKMMVTTFDNELVGIIHEVSQNFSIIRSILNVNQYVSVRTQSGDLGIIKYSEGKCLNLEDIQKHCSVNVGEVCVTSGYSSFFMTGVKVGVINKISEDKSGQFYIIKVIPSADIFRINSVYIIEDNQYLEKQCIKTKIK